MIIPPIQDPDISSSSDSENLYNNHDTSGLYDIILDSHAGDNYWIERVTDEWA